MGKKFDRILLVDDDVATNELHKIIIQQADAANEVHAVLSAKEALSYLTLKGDYDSTLEGHGHSFPSPCLIFLDINMPAMNGFEFMQEYKMLTEEQRAKYVIVMLTASLNPDDKKRAETIKEINGFRTKPLSKEILQELIATFL